MLFKNISYLDENFNLVSDAYVGTKNGVIEYISTEKPDWGYGEIYDGTGKLLIPGLVNNHCHAAMTLLRGYGEGLPLQEWLTEKVFPFEAKLTDDVVYWGALLGMAEMLASGVTSFSDMYLGDEGMSRAVLEAGMKCNYMNAPVCTDGTPLMKQKFFPKSLESIKKYGHSRGRFVQEFGLHAEYTACEQLIKESTEFSKKNELRQQVHISETKREHEDCVKRNGVTPAQYLDSFGFFGQPTNAAHCVWATDEDIAIFAGRGVTVTHCPSSNMKLGSGFMPLRKMLDAGVNVALGTDGASSNNNLNMFEEMHMAALICRGITGHADEVSSRAILKMATINGAKSQGRAETGLIKQGWRADLAVVDMSAPHLTPCYDAVDNLVFSAQAADVALTMVEGDVLYRDGKWKTIDVGKVREKISYHLPRILAQL